MMPDGNTLDRRDFLKQTAAGLGAVAAAGSMAGAADMPKKEAAKKVDEKDLIWRSRNPEMEYRRLGRTNYMASRIVAGWGGNEAIWRRMLARGMNYFDTARGYGNYEVELKDFVGKFRDQIWITSKATDVAGYAKIDEEVGSLYLDAMKVFLGDKFSEIAGTGGDNKKGQDLLRFHMAAVEKQKATGEKPDLRPAGKRAAELYSQKLDESLERLGTDHVDAYWLHGVEIPWIFDCLEVWEAYQKAHKAGKTKHFGFSTHKHQKEVLAAAVAANKRGPWKIDVAMPGVNPMSFDDLKPELRDLKKQNVGIVAMKTSGIKNRPVDGREKKLGELMGGREYNEWERMKLWMLNLTEDCVDSVIAAMKSNEEMEKDLGLATIKLSAAAERELRAIVKYEMAGACHLCGDCETHCPEHIAVTDMIRYHAYVRQYDEKALARELYEMAGYDPAKLCNNCGKCMDVCASKVPVTELLHQLSVMMA